jgi:hypothetical protein
MESAELQVLCEGTVTLDYHIVNVHFKSLSQQGVNNSFTNYVPPPLIVPLESVTLRFKELDYTFQPILPNCQKSGPTETFTWKFK